MLLKNNSKCSGALVERNPIKILVVDDDEMYRHTYGLILTEQGYDVTTASNGTRGLERFLAGNYPIVFVDFRMPDMNGIEFLQNAKRTKPEADIVLITAFASIETAVEAIKQGAYDYIDKPTKPDKLLRLVEKIIEKQSLLSSAQKHDLDFHINSGEQLIMSKNPKMRELLGIIAKISPTDSTVLIMGESGTGKEVIAKLIHNNSLRKNKPFFTMDCGTLVESLFESELFGHVKGSFTGATATKHGTFELAHQGTFFFDEIGNISLNVQAKILRAIQEKEIRRIGGTQTIHVNVRVIAATNLDLHKAVEEGQFREDLYYRLSVIPIYLPPLRERKEDIPLFAEFFIRKLSKKKRDSEIAGITQSALEYLTQYHWPGNIRELQNVLERALLVEESDQIQVNSLPAHITGRDERSRTPSLAEVEKHHIAQVLTSTQRNISKTARILGIDRKTLYDKIKKYEL